MTKRYEVIRIILKKVRRLALNMVNRLQKAGRILSSEPTKSSLLECAKFDKNIKKQRKKNMLENASFKKK